MKKIINIFLLIPCLILAFASCEIDNYDGPDAKFYGGIIDDVTGQLVETDIQNGSAIRAYELGFPTPTAQTWVIKQNGEFRNDLVFAAHYKIEFINGNFYPLTVDDLEIKKGNNEHDFVVTPYIRIKDLDIAYDAAAKKVNATFKLEAGKPEVKVKGIRLYAFTDMYVGEQVKFATAGSNYKKDFSTAATIDNNTTYTLSIDLNENATLFKYSRNYYFRVGAMASVSGVGTIRHNYAPLVKINITI